MTVTPQTASLTSFGATVQLTVQVSDQNGRAVAGAAVTWASSATAVATVDGSGLVTAVGNGTATIAATAGGVSGSAAVTVMQTAGAVAVSPPDNALAALGDTIRLSAEATDANGHAVAGAEFAWSSSDTLVATVDGSGLVTAVGNGTATIAATAGGVSGSAAVTVMQTAGAVAVSPPDNALAALGDTIRLSAEATDANGHAVAGAEFAWSSSDTLVATVDGSGLVTAVGNGTATIAATAGGASGTASVTVAQEPSSIEVAPALDTLIVGDTLRLVAKAFDANGHLIAGAVFAWETSHITVAAVDAHGLVVAVGSGIATITATAGTTQGAARITVITVADLDRAVLVTLYNATDGPNWVNDDNWLTDAPLADWYGVGTNPFGRVDELVLEGRYDSEARAFISHGLMGSIPAELGDLAALKTLRLRANELEGPIPTELGNLADLRWLDLFYNELEGPIPAELGNLANLEQLVLGSNELEGPIPAELGDLGNLDVLSLSSNELEGPIPAELGDLANLDVLSLGFNELEGPIPAELGELADLGFLYLHGNELEGPIPAELGNLADLRYLYLYENELEGPIPAELGNLVSLERLYLYENELEGPIPAELGNLVSLERLDVKFNELTGPIPTELGGLANLEVLWLTGNGLTGQLPASLLDLSSLWVLYWDRNAGLCAPDTPAFRTWLAGILNVIGPFCSG
ncbi:MAG: Ig-like domain-containing protein [Gemmatimonadetes bacterium]|nr:Ig-like domain-containing protein [Candidatus Palauibacter rhopaloidicola]